MRDRQRERQRRREREAERERYREGEREREPRETKALRPSPLRGREFPRVGVWEIAIFKHKPVGDYHSAMDGAPGAALAGGPCAAEVAWTRPSGGPADTRPAGTW